ncbi:MAG: hypothetical protein H2172_08465 [Opitutus sp.]|nr:hypothetical protein [Opitutus sp.]MCS6246560.1 hypothetical protein [Opitutus sp.]MCS6272755.1 hypothetical protein [Opitutus sp.]MCS6276387.1 hypothetical protein [Opitutus sp.]MCS6301965.1 hypothetical protein [Opitutus sp.]
MSMLVLIMVSMAALTRVETQIAANYQKADQARSNALLALNIALGKLQASAGPDQRVTANADILATTHATKKYWTGVWNPSSATPTWLLSGSAPNAAAADLPTWASTKNYDDTTNYVRLVGAASTDTSVTGNGIIVPLQTITAPVAGLSGTPTVARYGWWVGDEGVKARIDLTDPNAQRIATTTGSPSLSSVSPTSTQQRQSIMVPGRTGGELLATDASLSNTTTMPASATWPWSVRSGVYATPYYLGDATGAYEATNTANDTSVNFNPASKWRSWVQPSQAVVSARPVFTILP